MLKKIVDKLVDHSSTEECTENFDEAKIAEITLSGHGNVCVCSGTVYVVLIAMIFIISIGIGVIFAYSCWYLKKDVTRVTFGARTQWNFI